MAEIKIVTLAPEEWQLYKQIRLEALLNEPQAFASSFAEVMERPDSHWQERLIEMLREAMLEKARALLDGDNIARFAAEIAEHKRDPYTLVEEIVRGASRDA